MYGWDGNEKVWLKIGFFLGVVMWFGLECWYYCVFVFFLDELFDFGVV